MYFVKKSYIYPKIENNTYHASEITLNDGMLYFHFAQKESTKGFFRIRNMKFCKKIHINYNI